MEHTLPPPPPPDAPRPDTFYPDLLRALARLVFYPLYRPFTDLPSTWGRAFATMGLRGLLMAGLLAILFKLLQHGLLLWALAHRTRLDPPIRPAGPWPLTAPLPTWQVVALVVALAVLIVLDRQNPSWPVHLRWNAPFVEVGQQDPVLILPDVDPDVLVLGRPYTRTWNELENRMETVPQEDGVYTVSQAELCTHATVVAPTRAGKTFNVTIPLIEFADRREGAGIFIDAKGDDLTGPRFDGQYPGAFHRRFNLRDFEHSFRLQLWVGRTVEERAERLAAALVPEGLTDEGRYFSNSARAAFTTLVLAHYTLHRQEPTLPEVLAYLRSADRRADLAQQLPEGGELQEALARITELRSAKTDALGGLDGVLAPLARPEVARFFAAPGAGLSIAQLLQAQARVCFTLPTGPLPVAKLIGRLVIQQFTQVVLDADHNTKHLKLLVVEDAANFVTPLLGTAMAQASSHNAAFVLIFQDLAQIRDEGLIQEILTNSGLKIVLGGIGDADAARFSRLFGSRERLFRTQTASAGRGVGQSHSSGSHRGAGTSQRGGSASRQQSVSWGRAPRLRAEFTATELRELPDHHAVIERRDQQGHLTPATLVHFDADLQRTLTQAQRQARWGPYAEPLNHLQPLFPWRPQAVAALAASTRETTAAVGDRTTTAAPKEHHTGAPPPLAKSSGAVPSVAADGPRPPLGREDAQAAAAPPEAARQPDAPAGRSLERQTRPLPPEPAPAGGDATGVRDPEEGRPAALLGTPPARVDARELDDPTRDTPACEEGLASGPPPPLAASGRAVPPLVQARLPFAPAAPEPAAPPLPAPTLDSGWATQLLIKQLGVEAGAARLLAVAAQRQGYTPATFAALLAEMRALPAAANPRGVLYQRLTQQAAPPPGSAPPA